MEENLKNTQISFQLLILVAMFNTLIMAISGSINIRIHSKQNIPHNYLPFCRRFVATCIRSQVASTFTTKILNGQTLFDCGQHHKAKQIFLEIHNSPVRVEHWATKEIMN
ncbi:hypothetical protein [Natronoflexus pectinivorans]|uniref:Uncharacterized protein n=1 Tax=Natronoflexus pectinivorans TaxID=682526 RepID=A0A4R2G952_9BACT|nr:hypothetical protein [Natronoflexus pectinivorans]TCO04428.1 hypothetical protein EV194_11817 [Natronoflexus pectinivorans]